MNHRCIEHQCLASGIPGIRHVAKWLEDELLIAIAWNAFNPNCAMLSDPQMHACPNAFLAPPALEFVLPAMILIDHMEWAVELSEVSPPDF